VLPLTTLVIAGTLAACGTAAPASRQPLSPEPRASVPAQPTPTASLQAPTQAPTPSPSSIPDDPATTWQQLAHVVDEGQVRRVISEAGSVWAVGFTGQTSSGLGGVPVVWRSDAAEAWTRVELPIPAAATREPQVLVDVGHLAADSGRVFAFGSISALDSSRSVAWQSRDDGQTWTEVKAPPRGSSGPGCPRVCGRLGWPLRRSGVCVQRRRTDVDRSQPVSG
jgi:hypothetical protein